MHILIIGDLRPLNPTRCLCRRGRAWYFTHRPVLLFLLETLPVGPILAVNLLQHRPFFFDEWDELGERTPRVAPSLSNLVNVRQFVKNPATYFKNVKDLEVQVVSRYPLLLYLKEAKVGQVYGEQ